MANTIILCTEEELLAMFDRGEIDDEDRIITTEIVFDVLCGHYGVNPNWEPNDVY
jgi:hypothetical protein